MYHLLRIVVVGITMRFCWVFLTVCVIGLVLGEDSVENERKTVWPENVDIDAEVSFEILKSKKNPGASFISLFGFARIRGKVTKVTNCIRSHEFFRNFYFFRYHFFTANNDGKGIEPR